MSTNSDPNTSPQNDGSTTLSVVERPDEGRFVLLRGDEPVGFAEYQQRDQTVIVPHVETLARYRGNGLGAELLTRLLVQLRESDRTIVPLCSYAAGFIRDNAEYHDLLDAR